MLYCWYTVKGINIKLIIPYKVLKFIIHNSADVPKGNFFGSMTMKLTVYFYFFKLKDNH